MLDLPLAPNLPAGQTKTNILRCQPVSSSAPTQRQKCLFKYQKHEDALVHLHTCEVSFLLFDALVFLAAAVLMLTNPEVFIVRKQKYKPKLTSIFCCQNESGLQKTVNSRIFICEAK